MKVVRPALASVAVLLVCTSSALRSSRGPIRGGSLVSSSSRVGQNEPVVRDCALAPEYSNIAPGPGTPNKIMRSAPYETETECMDQCMQDEACYGFTWCLHPSNHHSC